MKNWFWRDTMGNVISFLAPGGFENLRVPEEADKI